MNLIKRIESTIKQIFKEARDIDEAENMNLIKRIERRDSLSESHSTVKAESHKEN